MPYGIIKVDTITFTSGGTDVSVPISGLVQNPTFTGNATVTGTLTATNILGTTLVSGATVTGTAGQFGTLTGNTAGFTTVTGATVTGNAAQFTTVTGGTAGFTTITGATVTGNAAQFTTVTGGTAGFTTITGATTTGTVANFVTLSGATVTGDAIQGSNITGISGTFTTIVSGATITGTAVQATSITGVTGVFTTQISGASGVIAGNITASAFIPTGSGVPSNGVYLPSGNTVGIATNGTERVEFGTSEVVFNDGGENYDFRIEGDTNSSLFFVDASTDRVGIGTTSPSDLLHIKATNPVCIVEGTGAYSGFSLQNSGGLTKGFVFVSQSGGVGQIRGESIAFTNADASAERARIDSSGRLLVGTSSARTNFFNNSIYTAKEIVEGTGATGVNRGAIAVVNNSSGDDAPLLILAKSRGTTVGSNTLCANNEFIGHIAFQANDGTEFIELANIIAQVDGTPGANDMPGRLVFSTTADGQSSPTERMRIDSVGDVIFNRHTVYTGGPAGLFYTGRDGNGNYFVYNGNNTGVYLTNGGTSWTGQSDERLKTDLKPIINGLDKVSTLRAVTGRFKTDEEGTSRSFLIAQDVQAVLPEAVNTQQDENQTLGLQYTDVIPLLVAALKESKERIETLEQRLADAGIA